MCRICNFLLKVEGLYIVSTVAFGPRPASQLAQRPRKPIAWSVIQSGLRHLIASKPHGNRPDGTIIEPVWVLSPSVGRPTAYGWLDKNKYVKEEIAHRLFIYGSPSIRTPYASKTSTLSKEELVFDKEKIYFQHLEIILQKIKENWSLIRKERSHHQNHEIIFPKIKDKFKCKTRTPQREKGIQP